MRMYKPVHAKTLKTYRPRFLKPFQPLLLDLHLNCMMCGVFIKPGTSHECPKLPISDLWWLYRTQSYHVQVHQSMVYRLSKMRPSCQTPWNPRSASTIPVVSFLALSEHQSWHELHDERQETWKFFFSHVHSLRTSSVKITQSRFQNQGWSRQARSYSLSTSGRSFIPTVSGYTACQANDKPFVLLSKHCPIPSPLSCWDVTSYELQTAIALAERVSNQTRS